MDNNRVLKSSDIDWVGNIPSNWEILRIKEVSKMSSGSTPKSTNPQYYENGTHPWLNTSDVQNRLIYAPSFYITDKALEDYPTLKYYPKETVLLAMYGGGTIGNVGIMTFPATINQACCAMIPDNQKIRSKYMYYYLQRNRQKIISLGFGGSQINLSQSIIAQIPITLPSIAEQDRIVDYLDRKLAATDRRMGVLEKEKDAYARLKKSVINQAVTRGLNPNVPLKDSGIDWVGMIPEHWETKRVKDVCTVVCGATPKDNQLFWDGDIIWISPSDMTEFGEIERGARTITNDGYQSCGTTLVPKDSIIISTRAPIGKTNIALKEMCTNQGCKCLTSKSLNMRYMLYTIWSKKEIFQALGRGTTFIELSTKDLSLFCLALPPISEQQAIAAYLDEKCAKIDAAIENIIKQIEASKRLKKAIINETISGKINF